MPSRIFVRGAHDMKAGIESECLPGPETSLRNDADTMVV